jgi:mRNA-degrading endonuclease RelE of RelBE toxin-antitoxin system
MAYVVQLRPAAQRQLDAVRGCSNVALWGVVRALAADPRPRGAARLVGPDGLWRLRVRIDGRQWRVIYKIDDRKRLVLVMRIARRDEGTYRGLR